MKSGSETRGRRAQERALLARSWGNHPPCWGRNAQFGGTAPQDRALNPQSWAETAPIRGGVPRNRARRFVSWGKVVLYKGRSPQNRTRYPRTRSRGEIGKRLGFKYNGGKRIGRRLNERNNHPIR
jgi:hypothetical protein